jgi:hypothetical protein
LEKILAMLLPSEEMYCGAVRTWFTGLLAWGIATERLMSATAVEIGLVRLRLSLQIRRVPKEDVIEMLSV